jgi:hypothetical protein
MDDFSYTICSKILYKKREILTIVQYTFQRNYNNFTKKNFTAEFLCRVAKIFWKELATLMQLNPKGEGIGKRVLGRVARAK